MIFSTFSTPLCPKSDLSLCHLRGQSWTLFLGGLRGGVIRIDDLGGEGRGSSKDVTTGIDSGSLWGQGR